MKRSTPKVEKSATPAATAVETAMPFAVRWPEDASRVVPLPAGVECCFRAAQPFTLVLESIPLSSKPGAGGHEVRHLLPEVAAVEDHMITWDLEDGTVGHTSILLLPDAGTVAASTRMQTSPSGVHGVLANMRGAAVQVRAAWGVLESKYDAWLAANLDITGPGDRRIVLPMVEMSLSLGADRIEVGADAVEAFESNGDSLRWQLIIQGIRISVLLRLGEGNAISALWTALSPVGADVEVRLRPTVDDRSFHQITKAFAGPEQEFPIVLEANDSGYAFELAGGHRLRVQGTSPFQPGPEWRYCVGLAQEASRGLEEMTDVYSAGEFVWKPAESREFELTACVDDDPAPLPVWQKSAVPDKLAEAMTHALDLYLSRRETDLTVIAGFPWFLDWGRDSLIFCRGLIACDRVEEAGQVLRRFAAYEQDGTLPNLLRGAEVTNRETSDAPLWWMVAAGEWIAAGGDPGLSCEGRSVIEVMRSIVAGYCRGTSTGVRLDPDSGLIFSPAHHSWMDTDRPCGTPRRGYPIEIQALWIASLTVLSRHDANDAWSALAAQAKESVERYFWREEEGCFADCLHAETGTPASSAVADDHLRPNQWLAIALGAVSSTDKARLALDASQCLLIPGGARSLAPRPVKFALPVEWNGQLLNDPLHPYWPRYTGPEDVSRKPAYHNGTGWCWLFPVFAEAMVRCWEGPQCLQAARKLLSASAVPWHGGCTGQLPENLDGDLPHLQRGCGAQAWSVSEWVRVWQLLGGSK